MNISQLIAALKGMMSRHGDSEVKVTWEGTVRSITTEDIYKSREGPIYIDADDGLSKKFFAADQAKVHHCPCADTEDEMNQELPAQGSLDCRVRRREDGIA